MGLLAEASGGYWVFHSTTLCFLSWRQGLPLNLEMSSDGLPVSAQSARDTGARGHAQLFKVDAVGWT